MNNNNICILYVTESELDVRSLRESLSRFEGTQFEITWQQSAEEALMLLQGQPRIDIVITEDVLPGMSGIEFTRKLREQKSEIPLVFLTTSKDLNLAVEVMRIGVKDYMLKEDVTSHIFPQSMMRIVEKKRLKQELNELEIKQKRLEAMQEIVVGISVQIREPLEEMGSIIASLEKNALPEKAAKYLKLIKDNVDRMQLKLEKLQNLKEDKTVKYIRDIKMIDLS